MGSERPACAQFEAFQKKLVLLFFQSTSYLKGVFPFAAWKWKSKQEMRMVLQGKVKASNTCWPEMEAEMKRECILPFFYFAGCNQGRICYSVKKKKRAWFCSEATLPMSSYLLLTATFGSRAPQRVCWTFSFDFVSVSDIATQLSLLSLTRGLTCITVWWLTQPLASSLFRFPKKVPTHPLWHLLGRIRLLWKLMVDVILLTIICKEDTYKTCVYHKFP